MSGFADLAATLAELEGIPSRIAAECADGITEQIRQQFDAGCDAYGNPWEPLLPSTVRRKRGDTRILRRTDKLSSQTTAHPTGGAGIEITSLPEGQFHQGGTRNMDPRPILPDGGDLPTAWEEIIQGATDRAFKRARL